MLFWIIVIMLSLVLITIGIYINFSKYPFAKKNLWKTGMVAGIIFNLITGLIPYILYWARITPAEWSIALIVPLYFPIKITDYFYSVFPINLGIGNILVFFFISLMCYGGVGAFIGYIISIFKTTEKEHVS